jgi:hypothetical protein
MRMEEGFSVKRRMKTEIEDILDGGVKGGKIPSDQSPTC